MIVLKPPPNATPLLIKKMERRAATVLQRRQRDGKTVLHPAAPEPPRPPAPKMFYHSGDLGDIVYALPTVRALGGGIVALGADNRSGMQVRERMTQGRFDLIAPLLRKQGYVRDVIWAPQMPAKVTHDLNMFRRSLLLRQLDLKPGYNLARAVLEHFKQPLEEDGRAWLQVDYAVTLPYRVMFSRSGRYHNGGFQWRRIVEKYKGIACFVGLESEYGEFCREFGEVPYQPTKDLLELARLLAGCKLFVGNQSCPFAVAEGLKVPVILEDCPGVSNTIFERPQFVQGCAEHTVLPEIVTRQTVTNVTGAKPRHLTIRGPLEHYLGFGQIVHAVADELAKRGWDIEVKSLWKEHQVVLGGVELLVCMHNELIEKLQGSEIVLTMWETDRVSAEVCKVLNEKARALIVPSQWNAHAFDEGGVIVPTHVVGLGIYPDLYSYQAMVPGPCTFGAAGRLAHGGERKGIVEAIRWFSEAFPTEKDVLLKVKCFQDCVLPEFPDPRVSFTRAVLSDEEMVRWYSSLTCFISAARGEGWGLHQHQAQAVGRPVIACAYGALMEFFNGTVGYPVSYTIVPATGAYEGKGSWAMPDRDDFIRQMRRVYENRTQADILGRKAAVKAAQFSWAKTAEKIGSLLNKYYV